MTTGRTDLPQAQQAAARLLRRDARTLVAVSGGLDSMCLLHFLRAQGYPVAAAHFNHGLRGARADGDEAFVRNWCAQNGIDLTVGRGDVRAAARTHGWSTEEAARRLRYDFLRGAMRGANCVCIAAAQHLDDNAETVLLNLIRGTGVAGLCGMRERQGDVVRPFLGQTRAELVVYAAAHGVAHVEDETNADPDAAARNRLRLAVMPELKKLNPRAAEHICAAARTLSALDDELEREARRRCEAALRQGGAVELAQRALADAPQSVRARMVLCLLDALGAPRADVGSAHVEAVLALAEAPAGKQADLPHGVVARSTGAALRLEFAVSAPEMRRLHPGERLRWGKYVLTLLDAPQGDGIALRRTEEAIFAAPCDARARLDLDGSRGARSVKRLCAERGIAPQERDALPMLLIGGQPAAVWPLGADRAFLPDGEAGVFVRVQPAEANE